MSHTLFSPERLIILSEITSTNDWIKGQKREKLTHGTVVRAIHQTQGRGQMGSSWTSTPGENLTFSILLKPSDLAVKYAFYLSKITGIALAQTLALKLSSCTVKIKWPNDIWVDGRKIAGILIENQLEEMRLASTILGIGLNVNQTDFGAALHTKASSIRKISGKKEALDSLLWELLDRFEQTYELLVQKQWEEIDEVYYSFLLGYGALANFERKGQKFQAWIEGVELDGRLILRRGELRESWDIKEIVWKGTA